MVTVIIIINIIFTGRAHVLEISSFALKKTGTGYVDIEAINNQRNQAFPPHQIFSSRYEQKIRLENLIGRSFSNLSTNNGRN